MLPQGFVMPYSFASCFRPVGCSLCYYTGYKGRRAIYEIIPVNSELAGIIKFDLKSATRYLEEKKYQRLSGIVFDLIVSGETSPEEAYPVLLSN